MDLGIPPHVIDHYKKELEAASTGLTKAHKAGIMMMSGTDSGQGAVPYGEWHAREMEHLMTYVGMTNMEAIQAGTIGNKAFLMQSDELTYNISSPVADVVSVSADFQATTDGTTNLTYSGQSGVQLTTGASIAFGALGNLSSVDNSASSANGGFAILHVPTNTVGGGVTTIKVQHSADNATFADLITFSTVAASTKTSELKAVSGTVNRYIRATASTAGSSGAITFMLSIARF